MYDYHLKFADEAEALSVLFDGETPKFRNIDVIGVITKVIDGADPESMLTLTLPGWHVNVRHAGEAPDLQAYAVAVNSPVRVWA